MRTGMSAVPTQLALLLLWTSPSLLKRGPSPLKLRCALRYSVSWVWLNRLSSNNENAGCAPLHDTYDSSQVRMDMASNEGDLNTSVPERLRGLAGRYINNPDSTVNGVYLESGPSGRFQVVITIDIGDVLGDTANWLALAVSQHPIETGTEAQKKV